MIMHTVKYAADMAGVTYQNIYYARKQNTIPLPRWIEGRLLYTEAEVDAIVEFYKKKGGKWRRNKNTNTGETK